MKTHKRIQDLLHERGYSGSGMARLCGVNPSAFRQWMFKDKVPISHIARLCQASGLEPSQIHPDFDSLIQPYEELVYYKQYGRWPLSADAKQ